VAAGISALRTEEAVPSGGSLKLIERERLLLCKSVRAE
jgi:hypothetical protein